MPSVGSQVVHRLLQSALHLARMILVVNEVLRAPIRKPIPAATQLLPKSGRIIGGHACEMAE